jgi:hypothetical protein
MGVLRSAEGRSARSPFSPAREYQFSAVQEYLRRGYDPIDILKEYPSLTAEDVGTARERLAG